MRKTADERANVVNNKLAEMAVAQRQIGEQVNELRAAIERNTAGAEETEKKLDRVLFACTAIQSSIITMANKAGTVDRGEREQHDDRGQKSSDVAADTAQQSPKEKAEVSGGGLAQI